MTHANVLGFRGVSDGKRCVSGERGPMAGSIPELCLLSKVGLDLLRLGLVGLAS